LDISKSEWVADECLFAIVVCGLMTCLGGEMMETTKNHMDISFQNKSLILKNNITDIEYRG
jgi:hypothetical protein